MSTEIRYKCHCMKEEASIQVPSRNGEDEDIRNWMTLVVQPSIYLDHRKRNSTCNAQNMEYAKILLPEQFGFIGQADKH